MGRTRNAVVGFGPIFVHPTDSELMRECLVDGPRCRTHEATAHDARWVFEQVGSLHDTLRATHEDGWRRVIAKGRAEATGGSWDYLGHGLELLRTYGPRWLDRDRLERLICAVGQIW